MAKIKEYKTRSVANSKIEDIPEVYGIKIFEKHFEEPDFIRERYIESAKLKYQFIHCKLIDVDNLSRNFTTRKYTKSMVY